jgi:hypothetical protein
LDRKRLLEWLDQLYNTRDAEIDCDQLQAALPALVDLKIYNAGSFDEERLSQVRVHLAQCPDCSEEFAALASVVLLESQERLPEADESLKAFETVTTFEHV